MFVPGELSAAAGKVFELSMGATAVDRVLLAEDLPACGQRVTGWALSALPRGGATWQPLLVGRAIAAATLLSMLC